MDGILSDYTVMQQNEWAGRRFFSAQDRRTGQVVYLVAAPAHEPLDPFRHPSLPQMQPLRIEGETRWLVGAVPEGDTLEDLRNRGLLTESELVGALLSVLDGLASLSVLEPAPVPAYLDPACIRRDRLGRWTLDYLALAHAPEARMPGEAPYGVHAFGVLLYWLLTGQTVRRQRVQISRMERSVSPALQFIVIRCLGKSYPGLAELRAHVEQAGREHEFQAVLRQQPAGPASTPPAQRPPELQYNRVTLGGPQIPMDDRPWALPPRPAEGYRKYVVPPPPNPRVVKAVRWGAVGLVSLASLLVAGVVAIKAGLVPDEVLPAFMRGPSAPAAVAHTPEYAWSGAEIGQDVPLGPPIPGPVAGPVAEPAAGPVAEPVAGPVQPKAPETAPVKQPPAPPVEEPPAKEPPQQAPATPVEQPQPQRPVPAPGSTDYQDAAQGGLPVMVYFNNRRLGYAYIFPHPTSPYISINTFNRLFGRTVFWVPQEGTAIRLLNGNHNVITTDYELVEERLWIKLTPFLQEALGIQVNAYNEKGMYFSSMP